MSIYTSEASARRFEQANRASGKRYDVGKSCVQLGKLDILLLDLIAAEVRLIKMEDYIKLVKRIKRKSLPIVKLV